MWIATALAQPFGFSAGQAPLDIPWKSVRACEDCHEEQAEDWRTSRHRVAHTNALYQAGLVDEPSPFCVNCHSPGASQAAEVSLNLDGYAWMNPQFQRGPKPDKQPEPRASEGVNCAACHVREGTILGVGEGMGAPHGVTSAPINSPSFCEGCHDFPMPEFSHPSQWTLTDTPMQSTAAEWRAWGGAETCVDCHMPNARHTFRGAYDLQFLSGALQVKRTSSAGKWVFELQSVGVGHAFPTGDLFRNLTLEVDRDGWTVEHRIGREFAILPNPDTGNLSKRLVGDTSLQPGVPQRVETEPGQRWRVRFHYGSAFDERRGELPDEALYAVIAEGT